MKFLANLINRIVLHWQSSLIGCIIGVLTYMLWHKDLTVTEWGVAIGTVITLKGILINKDPDKIENKPEVKEKEIK